MLLFGSPFVNLLAFCEEFLPFPFRPSQPCSCHGHIPMRLRSTFIWLAASLSLIATGCASRYGEHSFVIPTETLAADQRVIGISLSLSNACFTSFPQVPIGWSFDIVNDPSWQGRIEGQIIVGAAAIDLTDEFFRRQIHVRFGPQGGSSSNAQCRIVLKTTKSFSAGSPVQFAHSCD